MWSSGIFPFCIPTWRLVWKSPYHQTSLIIFSQTAARSLQPPVHGLRQPRLVKLSAASSRQPQQASGSLAGIKTTVKFSFSMHQKKVSPLSLSLAAWQPLFCSLRPASGQWELAHLIQSLKFIGAPVQQPRGNKLNREFRIEFYTYTYICACYLISWS